MAPPGSARSPRGSPRKLTARTSSLLPPAQLRQTTFWFIPLVGWFSWLLVFFWPLFLYVPPTGSQGGSRRLPCLFISLRPIRSAPSGDVAAPNRTPPPPCTSGPAPPHWLQQFGVCYSRRDAAGTRICSLEREKPKRKEINQSDSSAAPSCLAPGRRRHRRRAREGPSWGVPGVSRSSRTPGTCVSPRPRC